MLKDKAESLSVSQVVWEVRMQRSWGCGDAEEMGMWECSDIGMQEQGHRGVGTHGCKDSEM